jgi:melibiose permease/lactose/raffinose/galactose permease
MLLIMKPWFRSFKGDQVPPLSKWIYTLSSATRDAVDTLVAIFYILYIQYAGVLSDDPVDYALQFGAIITFLFVARLWDGINDPIIGSMIENTRWKIGKFKPWIFIGALLSSTALISLFYFRPLGWSFVLFFMIVYLLYEFSFTLNDIAYWSMLPSFTSQPKQRNEMTSLVTLFAALGAFSIVAIIPLTVAGDAADQYALIATITALLFLGSQTLVFLFVQERQREKDPLAHPKIPFFKMYTTLRKNRPLWWIILALFLYYMAASIINNFGLTYFYITLGYDAGGSLLPVLAIVFAMSTTLSQLIYPRLAKQWSRLGLIKVSFAMLFLGYILFFLIGNIGPLRIVPINVFVLIPIGFLIFSGQGIFYVTLMVMLANTIEYNDYLSGEREESVIYSLRPLAAKIGASIQSGFVYVFLIISGVYTVTSQISGLENDRAAGILTELQVVELANAIIEQFRMETPWGTTIFKVGMILLPLILFFFAFLIIKTKPILDEKTYQSILTTLKERKAKG